MTISGPDSITPKHPSPRQLSHSGMPHFPGCWEASTPRAVAAAELQPFGLGTGGHSSAPKPPAKSFCGPE